MHERVHNVAPEKALKMGLRDLLRNDECGDDEDNGNVKVSLKRKKGGKLLALGKPESGDSDDAPNEGDPQDELLKKSIACKKLENELKKALHEFRSSPYASKAKVAEHTQKLDALQKMEKQLDPSRMSKMNAKKLEQLAQSATNALENAKKSVTELKKLRKLDTNTVVYSEGGASKKTKR